MPIPAASGPTLYATSDLHVRHADNRRLVEEALRPTGEGDWLIVAGDIGDRFAEVEEILALLAGRFAKVIWAPGNHELWTVGADPVRLRGTDRYDALVAMCRALGVVTPEDEYPVWTGRGGPVRIAPLFVGYDYSFRVPGVADRDEAIALAYEHGVICTDEALLHPDPFPSRQEWCWDRVARTEQRLAACDPEVPLLLVNHYPLVREPTDVLRYPDFALWCGTERTADWHRRFPVALVVYGHLHIPRTTWYDGVRFQEVSLGYPREWRRRSHPPRILHDVLAPPVAAS
ncbi:metallophosphoesterase family protein [Melissospora conviva]|uniref:metallophosphoesterase family protein n=1 Tax=Melissospora conviva TaxID=3388432 RepID=UPI003B7C00B0